MSPNRKFSVLLLVVVALLIAGAGCVLTDTLSRRLGRQARTPLAQVSRTPRPTFTPTPPWTPTPTHTPTPTMTSTPTDTPIPTETPIPTDTPTPEPTNTPRPRPQPPTDTPAPPPTPEYPFAVIEISSPEFTHTTNPMIVVYVAITDQNNTPLGGYRVVGDSAQSPYQSHVESPPSCYNWCATSGRGGYIKAANVKFEPGPFIDGTWNIYLVDGAGQQVSPVVPLTYSTDPNAWRWDFVAFRLR